MKKAKSIIAISLSLIMLLGSVTAYADEMITEDKEPVMATEIIEEDTASSETEQIEETDMIVETDIVEETEVSEPETVIETEVLETEFVPETEITLETEGIPETESVPETETEGNEDEVELQEADWAMGECGNNLKWIFDEVDSSLTITGTGSMYNYSYPDKPAPWAKYYFGNVIIEEGVTTIGVDAFAHMEWITSVKLPKSLTTIKDYAFFKCPDLERVKTQAGLKTIGKRVFDGCPNLVTFEFPSTVTSIGDYAFRDCRSINYITFRGNVPTMGTQIFANDTATVYYKSSNKTWTSSSLKNTGGKLTLEPIDSLQAPVITNCVIDRDYIDVQFTKSLDATKYYLYVKKEGQSSYTKLDETYTFDQFHIKYHIWGNDFKNVSFRVKAKKGDQLSPYSNAFTVRYIPYTNSHKLAATSKGLKVTWDAVPGATGYQVYRATSLNGSYTKCFTTTVGSLTNYVDNAKDAEGYTVLANGQKYYYKVRVLYKYDGKTYYSAFSDPIDSQGYYISKAATTSVTTPAKGSLTVNLKVNKAVDMYEIRYSTKSDFSDYKYVKTTKSSKTITGLTSGKTYYVKVRSIKETTHLVAENIYSYVGNSYSTWSNVSTIKVK